jgi:ribosomal protein S18 acetylase RimI-like enzyme
MQIGGIFYSATREIKPMPTTDTDPTNEPRIRLAIAADVPVVAQIVAEAYRSYIPRIGRPPAPMLDNHAARVADAVMWVIEEGDVIGGILVLLPEPDHLLLDNIAVAPARQGTGLGRRLLAFAEAEAMRRGYSEVRLYTNVLMTENQRLYAAIGYEETGRGSGAGFERVFMRKRLSGLPASVVLPVQNQLEAYNAHDIDAFMQWWADDAQYYEFPARLIANGAAAIRERHVVRFREPNLCGRLINRLSVANLVIDQETVTRTFPDGPGEVDVIAIYEVENGKLAKAWFKLGTPRFRR